MRPPGPALALVLIVLPGCTSFSTVRSAEVHSGPSLTAQASFASAPGDDAAWFWSLDCASDCDHAILAGDLALAFGRDRPDAPPIALGVGVNGVYPYAEGYVQLSRSARRPFGVGARVGLPVWSWTQHQLYGRLDIPLGDSTALLWNPGIVAHVGNAPNGQHPGSLLGLVQGIGVEMRSGSVASTISAALVVGRAERTSYGRQVGPTTRAFGTMGIGMTFGRRP